MWVWDIPNIQEWHYIFELLIVYSSGSWYWVMCSHEIGRNHISVREPLQSNLRSPFHLGEITLLSSQNNNKHFIFQHCGNNEAWQGDQCTANSEDWERSGHLISNLVVATKGAQRSRKLFSWQARLLHGTVNFRARQMSVWLGAWICSPTQAYPLSSVTAKLFLPFKPNLSKLNAELRVYAVTSNFPFIFANPAFVWRVIDTLIDKIPVTHLGDWHRPWWITPQTRQITHERPRGLLKRWKRLCRLWGHGCLSGMDEWVPPLLCPGCGGRGPTWEEVLLLRCLSSLRGLCKGMHRPAKWSYIWPSGTQGFLLCALQGSWTETSHTVKFILSSTASR